MLLAITLIIFTGTHQSEDSSGPAVSVHAVAHGADHQDYNMLCIASESCCLEHEYAGEGE